VGVPQKSCKTPTQTAGEHKRVEAGKESLEKRVPIRIKKGALEGLIIRDGLHVKMA